MEPTAGWNEMQRILWLLMEGPYPDVGANLYRTIKIAMVDERIPYNESLGLIRVLDANAESHKVDGVDDRVWLHTSWGSRGG